MIRTGLGFDIHAFEKGRSLVLGGVNIKDHIGLKGHSDADVLIHAVVDAILGALGIGDIGELFPDTDDKFLNADSMLLLKNVMKLVFEKGFNVVNLDSVIICETPKILPYRDSMRKNIAEALCIDTENIMIKGKTAEKLGFLGRSEGIAAMCTVLLEKEKCL